MSGPAPVGLYSISVKGLELAELLSWAAGHGIPFVHLRGGSRGYDLAAQDAATLTRWRDLSATTVPLTGVTAEVDLADLLGTDPAAAHRVREQTRLMAAAAHALGARWLRLLARHPFRAFAAGVEEIGGRGLAVPLLAELHHPQWLAHGPHTALMRLLQQTRLRLLADTAQLAQALAASGDGHAAERLERLWPWIEVVHLSDPGPGLTGPGHALVADHAIGRIAGGQRVEVAIEWTGTDRTPAVALARYRRHVDWWNRRHAHHPPVPS